MCLFKEDNYIQKVKDHQALLVQHQKKKNN